ncbi:two-component sensor histidine kinase [Agrobacterium vitis]|nr:two-component sensor histidine kinase [Agrobacterium vitis]
MSFSGVKQAWPASARLVSTDDFLAIGGETAEEIRTFGWAETSLGPIETWPASLKATLRMMLSSKQPMCFWWGPDLLQLYNDAYLPILGLRRGKALGRPFQEIWSDVWHDVLPFVNSALSGEPTWMEDMPLIMTRNGYEEQTYWTFSYSPLYGDGGAIEGILNIVTETTKIVAGREALQKSYEEVQAHLVRHQAYEQELRLLNSELAHRMKNTLAMVQSIVSQSIRSSECIDEVAVVVSGRIRALAKAQDLLTGVSIAAADLAMIAENAVEPHRSEPDRFVFSGPKLLMSARQALGLSLALHELATNATKYGALSAPGGQVSICWNLDTENQFSLSWTETGGPLVIAPTRRGFGSKLTERAVADLFHGTAVIGFDPSGVVFSLQGRLDQSTDL